MVSGHLKYKQLHLTQKREHPVLWWACTCLFAILRVFPPFCFIFLISWVATKLTRTGWWRKRIAPVIRAAEAVFEYIVNALAITLAIVFLLFLLLFGILYFSSITVAPTTVIIILLVLLLCK
jgi:hypothetical protein